MPFPPRLALLLGFLALGCATPLQSGEDLYRQGDLRGALAHWRAVPEDAPEAAVARARAAEVSGELERLLRRYEKQAAFFEDEGRLSEALLYYRLVLKMEPRRAGTLARVQRLARSRAARVNEERAALAAALQSGDLSAAVRRARDLEQLDPFDPELRLELRRTRAAAAGAVEHHLARGVEAFRAGDRDRAARAFGHVLALDERNEQALGYLSYIGRLRGSSRPAALLAAANSVGQHEILAEGHFQAAQQALDGGEPYEAIAEYEAALRVDPRHLPSRRGLRAVRARYAPRVPVLYERGKRLFEQQDLQNAVRVWRQLLLIDPTHANARENVERAQRILSRLEELQTGDS